MIWVLTQTFNAWFDSVPESYLNIETSTNTQNWPTSQIVASLISPHFLVVFYSPSIIVLNSTIKNFLILHQVFLKFFTSLVRPHLIFGTFNLGLPPHFCIFLKNDSMTLSSPLSLFLVNIQEGLVSRSIFLLKYKRMKPFVNYEGRNRVRKLSLQK